MKLFEPFQGLQLKEMMGNYACNHSQEFTVASFSPKRILKKAKNRDATNKSTTSQRISNFKKPVSISIDEVPSKPYSDYMTAHKTDFTNDRKQLSLENLNSNCRDNQQRINAPDSDFATNLKRKSIVGHDIESSEIKKSGSEYLQSSEDPVKNFSQCMPQKELCDTKPPPTDNCVNSSQTSHSSENVLVDPHHQQDQASVVEKAKSANHIERRKRKISCRPKKGDKTQQCTATSKNMISKLRREMKQEFPPLVWYDLKTKAVLAKVGNGRENSSLYVEYTLYLLQLNK